MSTHTAWGLVCRLFADGAPVLQAALSPREREAAGSLSMAIKSTAIDQRYALCPYCELQRGQVWAGGRGGRMCHCPQCGPVPLAAEDLAAVRLDEDWLRRGLRLALGIDSRDAIDSLGDGVWRLGDARRAPVVLARRLERLWSNHAVFDRVRVAGGVVRVVAPRPSRGLQGAPFAPGVEWLPLEERFTVHGGGIAHFDPGVVEQLAYAAAVDPSAAVHGPFSADFRWIHLPDWPHGAIHCSPGQAAVFKALWSFRGEPRDGAAVMARASLASDKPADLFKVKARDRGDHRHEGAHFAYRQLVVTQQRPGLYEMPCARGGADGD